MSVILPDAQDAASIIAADYQRFLGRAPDASSLLAWQAQLVGGLGETAFIGDLAGSAEAQGDISNLYQSLLGRSGTASEIARWQAGLGGTSLAAVRTDIAGSTEAGLDITGMYQRILGRTPTAAEVALWQNALATTSLSAVQAAIAGSPEAAGDIGALYQQVLGRSAGATEIAGWQSVLGGSSLAAVQSAMEASPEAQADIAADYHLVYNAVPTAVDLAPLDSQLESGSGLSQVEATIQANFDAAGVGDYTIPDFITTAPPTFTGLSIGEETYGTIIIIPFAAAAAAAASTTDSLNLTFAPNLLPLKPDFTVSVDGQQVGTVILGGGDDGAPVPITFKGDWGLGPHSLALAYTGAAGGSGDAGPVQLQALSVLDNNGANLTQFTYAATATISTAAPAATLGFGTAPAAGAGSALVINLLTGVETASPPGTTLILPTS